MEVSFFKMPELNAVTPSGKEKTCDKKRKCDTKAWYKKTSVIQKERDTKTKYDTKTFKVSLTLWGKKLTP